MKIIEDLIQDLISDSTNIESALLKAQVLANQLGDTDMKNWVEQELRGYGADALLPDYRILRLTIIGDVSNGYWRHPERVLPVFHLNDAIRKKLTTHEVRGSISAVKEMANPGKNFGVAIQPEYFSLISENFEEGYAIETARGVHSTGSISGIITQVKSRLLDFILTLSGKISEKTPASELKSIAGSIGVNEMFKNAIFGNNTTIIVGNNNSQSVSSEIRKNDLNDLSKFLTKHGVSEPDISDLGIAISADSAAVNSGANPPGENVKGWVSRMISKAGSTSWEISTEAAGNLLAAAIAAFYGLT